MARRIDPVCKLCRREGIKLYLKGSRCEGPKCPVGGDRGRPAPGMHGFRRGKQTEYGVRLREKQKVKRFYGVLEKQFRRYFQIALRSRDNTGDVLMTIFERRLDNVVHRLGLAQSRAAARQLVNHGHIVVNERKCDIPSRLLRPGDVVQIKNRPKTLALVKENMNDNPQPIPDFLEMIGGDPPEARMTRMPTLADVDPRLQKEKELNENLIIEFCSR